MQTVELTQTVTLQPSTPTQEDLALAGGSTETNHQVVVIHLPPGCELHELTAIHTDPTADHMY